MPNNLHQRRSATVLGFLTLAVLLALPGPLLAQAAAAVDGTWAPLSSFGDPTPRARQSAVWTGTQMVIWGGEDRAGKVGSGAAYSPADDRWHALPLTGAPSPRSGQSAVWTGKEMLIWGGEGNSGMPSDGAAYNPVIGRWRPLSSVGAPSPRAGQSTVWTGSAMLVWGGLTRIGPGKFGDVSDGAAYDPATDTWSTLPTIGTPGPRDAASAVWTGDALLIWGGSNAGGPVRDGAAYHPESQTWTLLSTSGEPSARSNEVAIWTGSELLIWGGLGCASGNCGDGAAYNPKRNTWRPLPLAGAPAPRFGATAVWTGDEALVWGGARSEGVRSLPPGDGAAYDPTTNSWRPLPASGAPAPRLLHTAIWTGTAMLMWGGQEDAIGDVGDGAAYTPPAMPAPNDQRYFAQAGYRIDNDGVWDYFIHRGGLRSFGYPTSRTVIFMGHTSQFFQRDVLQQYADGSVHSLNLLDSAVSPPSGWYGYGILPFTTYNFSVFPAADPALAAQAPNVYTSHDYAAAVIAFVQAIAPDTWNGLPVHFFQTFVQTVTLADAYPTGGGNPALLPLLNLEVWGVPISAPAYDPSNHAFVYQRFQRGIMHARHPDGRLPQGDHHRPAAVRRSRPGGRQEFRLPPLRPGPAALGAQPERPGVHRPHQCLRAGVTRGTNEEAEQG
ncbi:MAG: Kelch repeat-containing protein [Chloroflexota bacterium]